MPAIRWSRSGLGSSVQTHHLQPDQLEVHHDSKPEICSVVASLETIVPARNPTNIATFSRHGHETPELQDSAPRRAQEQRSALPNYPQPAPITVCQTDAPQRLQEGWISNEENGREFPEPPTAYPGRSNPRIADCRNGPKPGDLKLFHNAALNLPRHEPFRGSLDSLQPEIVQTDTPLDVLNPLDTGRVMETTTPLSQHLHCLHQDWMRLASKMNSGQLLTQAQFPRMRVSIVTQKTFRQRIDLALDSLHQMH